MRIMVYSLLWVMQGLYHQPYEPLLCSAPFEGLYLVICPEPTAQTLSSNIGALQQLPPLFLGLPLLYL